MAVDACDKGLDFADALHLARSSRASVFATFDQRLAKRAKGLALAPPVERTVLVAKLDVVVRYAGHDHALGSNEFADGTVDPHGYRLIESFALDGSGPVWRSPSIVTSPLTST